MGLFFFSSMGNVDLLPQEKETVLQNLPQVGLVPMHILKEA